jgi:hypothetical protein
MLMERTCFYSFSRFKAYGAAELDWFFSCRQDLFTHVDQLCCFDLDDSATKVTTTRALDHIRRMFVTLQVGCTISSQINQWPADSDGIAGISRKDSS